jgi:hypothetical protein
MKIYPESVLAEMEFGKIAPWWSLSSRFGNVGLALPGTVRSRHCCRARCRGWLANTLPLAKSLRQIITHFLSFFPSSSSSSSSFVDCRVGGTVRPLE